MGDALRNPLSRGSHEREEVGRKGIKPASENIRKGRKKRETSAYRCCGCQQPYYKLRADRHAVAWIVDQWLRLVATEAVSEVSVVGLVPAGGRRGLTTAITCVTRDLAITLASHSRLIPSPLSWSRTCNQTS